jgi:hypothetical protein
MMLIKSALQAYVDAQLQRYRERHKTSHSRYIGASEVGLCIRRIWYSKQTLRTPLDTKHSETEGWGAARRGATFERYFWLKAMRAKYGDNLLYAGGRQRTMQHDHLRATPDGLLINQSEDALAALGVLDIGPSGEIVVECKTIDPRIPLQTAKPEHEFQAQVQLGMFRLCTEHRPLYAVISYTNASFFDDVIEFVVRWDPDVFGQAVKRAAKVMQSTDARQLQPEGWTGGGKECQWCRFKQPCDAIRLPTEQVNDAVAIDPQIISELVAHGRNERALATKVSALQEEQRNIQEAIKSRLRDLSLRRIEADGIKIVWSPVKGRPSFDMVKLREAASALGLDIQKFETVGEATDRLIITLLPHGPRGHEDSTHVKEQVK